MFELFIALIAGVVAFLSPCVLPLVPAYISYMSGKVSNTVAAQVEVDASGAAVARAPNWTTRFSTGIHALAFVAGFTTVFVTFGLVAAALEAVLTGVLIRLGGVLIILFGLHFMGVVPRVFSWLRARPQILGSPLLTVGVGVTTSAILIWGFTGTLAFWDTANIETWTLIVAALPILLMWVFFVSANALADPQPFWTKTLDSIDYMFYADTRREMAADGNKGLAGSYTMGLVFSAGWTPCIGPTLGAAMGLAASQDTVLTGAAQMTAFSLGLGIPFVLSALMLDSAQGQLRKLNKHMNKIKVFTGGLLIFIGIMMVSGELQNLSARMNAQFADFSWRLEECTVGIFEGEIGLNQAGSCYGGSVPYLVLEAEHTGEELDRIGRLSVLAEVALGTDTSAFDIEAVPADRFHECAISLNRDEIPGDYATLCLTSDISIESLTAYAASGLTIDEVTAQLAAAGTQDEIDPGPADVDPNSGEPITELPETTDDAVIDTDEAESITGLSEAAAEAEPEIAVGTSIGDRAPDFQTVTHTGEELSLSDFRGQVVLLNFWYTTCPPCRIEMPEFEIAAQEYSDDLVILAVNREEGPETIEAFAEELGLRSFPLLLDQDAEIIRDYSIRGFPTSLLIGPDGVIINSFAGLLNLEMLTEWVEDAKATVTASAAS